MNIGGLQKYSFCDYPGKVAAVVFTNGCNFRCPFCHNGSLVGSSELSPPIDENAIHEFLSSRIGKLDGVVVTGGEPTIHNDLARFIGEIKKLGFCVKLDTNGSNPLLLRALLDLQLLDFIAMDVKAPLSKYELLAGTKVRTDVILDSIEVTANSGVPHEFRTTFVEAMLNRGDLAEIRRIIPQISPHRIQTFRSEHCLNPTLCDTSSVGKASDRFAAI